MFKDGSTYHLYAAKGDWSAIDHYTSTDRVTWTLAQDSVLTIGGGGTWDAVAVANTFIWKEGVNDWRMLYEAKGASGVWKIGYATSSDGYSWSKSGSNPVIDEVGSRGGPWVTKIGSTYYLWCHQAVTGALPTDICLYHSTDLATWTSLDGVQFARSGADEGAGGSIGQVADPFIIIYNHVIYLYYSAASDGGNESRGLAT